MLNDIPSLNPSMHFDRVAEIIYTNVINSEKPQFNIGIFGGYGYGKTSLLLKIKKQFDMHKDDTPKVITVFFESWRYDQESSIVKPLLCKIYGALRDNVKMPKKIKLKMKTAFKEMINTFEADLDVKLFNFKFYPGKAIKASKNYIDSNIEKIIDKYTDVSQVLKTQTVDESGKTKRIFVIFLDDLDRCLPGKAFRVLELIKSILDIPGFIFVFALDPRVLETFLYEKYGEYQVSADEYLQKIIQLPFYIPKYSDDLFKKTVISLAKESTESNEKTTIMTKVIRSLLPVFPRNLRQVKLIINLFVNYYDMYKTMHAGGEIVPIHFELLFKFGLFRFKWPKAYWFVSFKNSLIEIDSISEDSIPDNIIDRSSMLHEIQSVELQDFYRDLQIQCAECQIDPKGFLSFYDMPIGLIKK